jgi:hypothetical protein
MITHPEKLLFPGDGITKGDLAAYYEAMAPVILPHLRGRPVTMERYPAGIGEKAFWQKDPSKGFPPSLQRVEVPKKDGVVHSSRRNGHALAAVGDEPAHDHTARLDLARAPPGVPGSLRVRSRSVHRRHGSGARRRDRSSRPPRRARVALVDQDLRLEGFSHHRPGRRQDADGRRCPLCERRGNAVREPCPRSPHPGVQQGRSRRADLRGHREERLQRHVRGRPTPGASRRPATCGPACGAAGDR